MPKSIIDEIKAAEAAATEIRKNADISVKDIIDGAKKEADSICKETTLNAVSDYEKRIAEAKKTAEAQIDENRRLSYENAAAMTEIAKNKTDVAVKLIIDRILEG